MTLFSALSHPEPSRNPKNYRLFALQQPLTTSVGYSMTLPSALPLRHGVDTDFRADEHAALPTACRSAPTSPNVEGDESVLVLPDYPAFAGVANCSFIVSATHPTYAARPTYFLTVRFPFGLLA